jgi:2-hydroxycyclohexanecarboxyl-CoA dehydrogenase
MEFQNKTAIITGAASGIGKAVALTMAQLGANVAVVDISLAGAELVAAEVIAMGSRGLAFGVDVSNQDQVESMVDAVYQTWGDVEVLVNNAGWDEIKPFMETTPEFWTKSININFKGMLYCTKAVLKYMLEQRRGAIVNVASDAGRVGSSGEAIYSATKGAMLAFTKAIAREMVRYGIRVNCVCPGLTDTPMLATVRAENPKLVDAIIKAIPMRRLGHPKEIAQAIVFFASDEASYITGQTLSVNGGLNML